MGSISFSDATIRMAFGRCGARCECTDGTHEHNKDTRTEDKCNQPLVFDNRGKDGFGGWEAYPGDVDAGDNPSNCTIICMDCYKQNCG